MTTNDWKWARLNRERLQLLKEAEQALGAGILMAYQPENSAQTEGEDLRLDRLQVASLSESQLECLAGLESQLQAVVVAYEGLAA